METFTQQQTRIRLTQHLALYIHIPFCETKCPYCDFNTYSGIESRMPAYLEALLEETCLWGTALVLSGDDATARQSITSVFFGGGTPSYLPPEDIRRILDTVRASFSLSTDAEVTLESNPGDVTADRLRKWKDAGINRLSIGVQSLDDDLLKVLGRRHNAREACLAYRAARDAGFDNVNLDLMYGLPNQTLTQWRTTLEDVLALTPDHLSLYCLTLEEGTPMEAWMRHGTIPVPDPDLAADMYELAEEQARMAGYEHYEISNWALPRKECRHNMAYWENRPYLGLGPGAHSFLPGYRFANLRSPRWYVQRIHQWSQQPVGPVNLHDFQRHGVIAMVEAIDPPLEMAETLMLGLRLGQGVTDEDFTRRFGVGFQKVYGAHIGDMEALGLLCWQDGRLRLTPRGRLLGNEVFQRFFA